MRKQDDGNVLRLSFSISLVSSHVQSQRVHFKASSRPFRWVCVTRNGHFFDGNVQCRERVMSTAKKQHE